MSFSKLTLISAAMFLGGAALVPAAANDIVVTDEGYTIDLNGRTDTLNGSFLSQDGSLADQGVTQGGLYGHDAGTVRIEGGGSLTYAGGAGAGYYKDVYTMSRGEDDQEALEEAWKSMDSFWSAGVFTGSVEVGKNTTLVLEGQLSQYVSFQRPTAVGANEISTPAFSGYAGIRDITLKAGATVSFEGSTLNMFDSRPNLTSNVPTEGYNPTAVLALNMLNNLKADSTSRLIIGTDAASVNRIVLNTTAGENSTVGRLVGNGRLYVTGAGTISFIGESELDPGTRVDADGERDVSGNTWLAGNKLADILLGAGTVNVGSADGGATVVDNVFDGATSVSFLRSDASNATVAGASNGGMFVNGAADYLGDIRAASDVNIYGHQVFNNFQSLWTERTMLSAEGSTIGSPVNQVYEPVRFSWRNPDGSVPYSNGVVASVWVQDGAVLTINQSYGRDGWFTGSLNSTGSGLVVKTGEGQFLYQGAGTLGHLRIEEGNWIAAGNSLSDCKVEVSGTGSLNLLVSNTGTFAGEVTALSRDATLLLSRSYTLINDLEEQPDTVLENADSLTEDDYRTYGQGLDSQTAALQITSTQTLFYGTVSVTEGVTLILGETGGDAYASIFPNAGSIELLGDSGAAAGQRRYSTLNIYSGTQLVQNLSGTADASAVTVGSGAKLVLTQTDADTTYAGGFSGSGDLVKLGANTQRVAGDLNGELFSGRLIVLAGGVAVDQGTSSGGTAALLMKSGTSASFSGPGQVSALIGETGSTVTISGDFRVSQSTADTNFLKNPANLVYTNDEDVYDGAFSKIYATTGTDRDGNDVFGLMKTGGSNLFGGAENVSSWLRATFTQDAVEDFLASAGENLSSEMQESLRELAAAISGSSTGVLTYLDGDGNLNASGWNSIVAAGGLELLKEKDPALKDKENLPDESLYSFITYYARIADSGYTYEFILTRSNASQISGTYGVSNSGWFSGTAPNYGRFAASFGFSADAEDQAFAGTLTGAGSLIKDGAGTLKLTGSNAYTGATTVNAGTLEANRNSIQATSGLSIASGATFVVNAGKTDANPTEANPDQTWGTEYSELFSDGDARLSGTGTLIKRGDGNVSLGNALLDVPEGGQEFSGTVQVSAGALRATINPAARSALSFSVAFDAETARFELDFARDGTIANSAFTFIGDAAAEVALKGSVDGNGMGVFALDAGTTRNAAGELVGNNVLSVSATEFSVNEAKVDSGTLKFVVAEDDRAPALFKSATLGEGAELFFDLAKDSELTLDDASVSGKGTLVVATT
ncbi:MAG TPA: autotransporter-associated beta strand repeat-containing protein, partial [Candidatus Spyradosoma merdigallinarum]|nr:autotransporter-associated beta strand repeat-containing protein [Candidatus Spyradosoma merdigallinarum]